MASEVLIPKLLIAPASLALVQAIQAINEQCFAEPWPLRETWSFLSLASADAPLQHVAHVAIAGGRVIGFSMATFADRQLQLHRLAVLPAYRRRGVGAKLLAMMERKGAQHHIEAITIVIREENLAAQVYFRGRQYRAPGRGSIVRDAFDDGTAGLVMAKQLDGSLAPTVVRVL